MTDPLATMPDIIELMAKAIQKADFEDSEIPWDRINPEGQNDYRKYAEAALIAFWHFDVTDKMIKLGNSAISAWSIPDAESVWRSMLMAAIPPAVSDKMIQEMEDRWAKGAVK